MESPTNYVNDHARLLDKLSQQADAEAAEALRWLDKLVAAKVEAAQAEELFAAKFTTDNAREFVEAKNRVRDLTHLAGVVESIGGAAPEREKNLRERNLRTPLVFSSFSKGFEERCDALQKLLPNARKQMGARLAALAESGIQPSQHRFDPTLCALALYCHSLESNLEVATNGKVYADARGVSRTPMTFADLYGCLTAPLPQAPTIPTPTA